MSAPDVFFVQSRISQALHRKSRMATEAGEPDIMHFMCKAYQPQRRALEGRHSGFCRFAAWAGLYCRLMGSVIDPLDLNPR